MNTETLERQNTREVLINTWRERARNKLNTASEYVFYTLCRAVLENQPDKNVEQYLKEAFKPVTNINKLANGRYPYDTLYSLLRPFSIKTHTSNPIKFNYSIELFVEHYKLDLTNEQKEQIRSLAERAIKWSF